MTHVWHLDNERRQEKRSTQSQCWVSGSRKTNRTMFVLPLSLVWAHSFIPNVSASVVSGGKQNTAEPRSDLLQGSHLAGQRRQVISTDDFDFSCRLVVLWGQEGGGADFTLHVWQVHGGEPVVFYKCLIGIDHTVSHRLNPQIKKHCSVFFFTC